MFQHSTKQAIKTGLALSISLLTVHWLGWQKSSWVMLTVFVLSLTENYGYSALKSQNRLLGTLLGASMAFVLLALFSQQRGAFLSTILLFFAFCVYMNFDKRRGYLYNIAITVCLVIASAGINNGAAALATAILRLQDTLLGLVIFSLVYRLVWPTTGESEFFRKAENLLDDLEQEIAGAVVNTSQASRVKVVNQLQDILHLPSSEKTTLAACKSQLSDALNGMTYIIQRLATKQEGQQSRSELEILIAEGRSVLEGAPSVSERLRSLPVQMINQEDQDIASARFKGLLVSLGLAISALVLWIALPIPGGAMFPVFGLIVAANIASAPANYAAPVMLVYILFAGIVLLQYVFVFPLLTVSWQLAILFFINIVLGYLLLEKLHMTATKMLMGNALINMVGSATELVPSYDIVAPLTMLVFLFIVMALFQFYAQLFSRVVWRGIRSY
ncbi:FUSC family protein [Vibrio rotiferianus]|jgi:hypothetical protein|uniref:FUSC family protein n=1 Tax=Vibrio rotiferianus TaxID=190895 RepID=UPI0014871B48|nr:FUSC family protein [Vibrio rotiferianus]